MKIKEIEAIVRENIEKRETEIGREFNQKEKAIAILVEQLKIMEFDPGYFWGIRKSGEIHKETIEKLKEKDVGEIEVDKQATCKILSTVYKYIADNYGLNVYFIGSEDRNYRYYMKIAELQDSSIDEHIYTIVKVPQGELKIDVQDESQAIKIKAKPRNLGQRKIPGYMFTQEQDELYPILTTIGYIKENEEYRDVYISKKIKNLEQEPQTQYETIKMILEDEFLEQALKNSGAVSSYKFYKDYIRKAILKCIKNEDLQESPYFILPCHIKREANGKEQISYSYILFVDCDEKQEIYMYSDSQGGLVKTEPKFINQMLEANLNIGHGQDTREDAETIKGRRKLINYINTQIEPNQSQGEEK